MVIKASNVIDGYENNPEANATVFVKGGFGTGDGGQGVAEGYPGLIGGFKDLINRVEEKFFL